MHALLIVDDVGIFVDQIAEMVVAKTSLDLDIYKAYSGKQALAVLHEVKVDILLTDVVMSDLTGIELQAEASRLWPRCRTVFLTVYNDFASIQAAIRQNAVDYILKTEDDAAIIRAVQYAADSIDGEVHAETAISKLESRIRTVLPVLQQMYMEDIFKGSNEVSDACFLDYAVSLDPGSEVLMLVGQIDELPVGNIHKAIYHINRVSANLLKERCNLFTFVYDDQYIVWLMQPLGNDSHSDVIRYISGNLGLFQKVCRDVDGIRVSVILAESFVSWANIVKKFNAMRRELDEYSNITGEMILLEYESDAYLADGQESESDLHGSYIEQNIDYMRKCLRTRQQDEFFKQCEIFKNWVFANGGLSNALKVDIIMQINQMFYSVIRQKRMVDAFMERNLTEPLMRVDDNPDLIEKLAQYRDIARLIFENESNLAFTKINKVLGRLRQYIMANINRNLSLHRLAEVSHFNPSYLSRLFKIATNKNITEYINEMRVRHACSLLRDTDMKIMEVANAVGYDNQQSFSRFFRKNMKISPAEFREKNKA